MAKKDAPLVDVTIVDEEINPDEQENSGQNLDEKKRHRSKHLSILEGALVAISTGFSTNYISAFAIALGASNMMIALLASLPNLIAAVFQLGVQRVKSWFKSRRTYMIVFSILQAIMWLPMIYVPNLLHPGLWLLLFVTMASVFAMLIGPIWNSYMGDLVEEDGRGQFFGTRNMFTGLSAFIATLLAGWILHSVPQDHKLFGFMILFALAFLFRIIASYFTSKMVDIPDGNLSAKEPDVTEFIKEAEKTPLGKFTTFLMLFYIAVYLAAPFFAVYQLSILKFDYLTFTLLVAASAISSFLAMLFWGKYVDRIGSRNVLVFCGFLIPLVPLIWVFSTNPWVLVYVEAFSGIIWAGFNLSVSTYLFDITDRAERTRKVAVYTLFIQLSVFIGAMIGTLLLGMFDKSNPAAYKMIFLISAVLRLLFILIFFKSLRELRIVEIPVRGRVFNRFVSVTPRHGIMYEPSMENTHLAGNLARKDSKQVGEDVRKFAGTARGVKQKESSTKKLERSEDEQDAKSYLNRVSGKPSSAQSKNLSERNRTDTGTRNSAGINKKRL